MSRRVAYQVLRRVEEDEAFSNRALDAELASSELDGRDRRLATELAYGVLTWQRALDNVLEDYVHGGIGGLDRELLWILRLGVYQILFLDRIPDHAVVDEAVDMTRELVHGGATSLVNAVLREITRADDIEWWEDADRERKIVRYLGDRYSMANWMANRLVQLYGEERAEELAEALSRRPPLYLRALGPNEISEVDERLESVDGVPKAIRAEKMNDTIDEKLAEKRWIIQDVGSQLVGLFVDAQPGETVLDACAGLGGKSLCLADAVGDVGKVVAVDSIKWKVDKLERLADQRHLAGRIDTHAADLREVDAETIGAYDRVLVDAPCSALGVLRRHPEIRWRRKVSDIPALVELQRELLDAAADLVREGGLLAYSVCTFTSEEGPKQIDAFLERHPEFERAGAPDSDEVDWSRFVDEQGDLRVDPVQHDSDIFYAARLRKRGDSPS